MRAPKSRVYSSAPAAPRQQRFQPKANNTRLRSTHSGVVGKKRQSTLTQLDFEIDLEERSPSPDDAGETRVDTEAEEEVANSAGEDWEQPPPKRRRFHQEMTESERKRQQTLTQMDWDILRAGGGNFEVMEDEMSDVQQDDNAIEPPMGFEGDDAENTRLPTEDDDSPLRYHETLNGHFPLSSSQLQATRRLPRTPVRRNKHEIPSSQSPVSTPLTTSRLPLGTHQPQRTPLSEIHPNVLAMRDLETASSEKSAQSKRSPKSTQKSPDEVSGGDGDDYASDNENYMPDSSDAESEEDVGAGSPTRSIKHTSFMKPRKSKPFPLTPSKLRQNTAVETRKPGPETKSQEGTRSSQASATDSASPDMPFGGSPSRHSQIVQQQDQRSGNPTMSVESSLIQHPRYDPHDTLASELPASLFENVPIMASINDSAEIITASQLMKSSQ